ncbi:MAG: sigma-70 family RNA polymerase sigma factor [Bacteroidia bacterium]
MIRQGGEALSSALRELYDRHHREMIRKLRKVMGSEAEDVFHDSLVALVENVSAGKFSGRSSLKTYLQGIADKQCLRRYRQTTRAERYVDRVSKSETHTAGPDDDFIDDQLRQSVNQLLTHLPPKCREILTLWAQKYSMREIAQKLNYENETVVRTLKSRCLKNLATTISENPGLRKMLEEWKTSD